MATPAIFPRFSEAEYARREAAVRREMAAHDIDALIVVGDSANRTANQANVYGLTSYIDPGPAYAIVTSSSLGRDCRLQSISVATYGQDRGAPRRALRWCLRSPLTIDQSISSGKPSIADLLVPSGCLTGSSRSFHR